MNDQLFFEGSLKKQMIIFAVPLVCTSILLQLFNTADTAMAGHFIGKDALAAVGGTMDIYILPDRIFCWIFECGMCYCRIAFGKR